MPASTEITERHRSLWKAFTWGVCVFTVAAALGWVAAFDCIRIPGSTGLFLDQSAMALTVFGRAMLEVTGFHFSNYVPVMQVLARGGLLLSFFGRIGIVFAAALSIRRTSGRSALGF